MPDDLSYFDDDIVDLRLDDGTTQQFFWGDACVRLPDQDQNGRLRIRIQRPGGLPGVEGFVRDTTKLRDSGLLRLAMIDVQQGDGLILQTPDDKIVFIDGGDNVLFARFVAAAFSGTSDDNPAIIDAMVITHGDADHFAGLSQLRKSETLPAAKARKRVFVAPKRVYHNGLVKRPSTDPATGKARKDEAMFGTTVEKDGQLYITDLVDDIADVPSAERNREFNEWAETLAAWDARTQNATGNAIERRRIDFSSHGAFDFLNDGIADNSKAITVELLGPVTEQVGGGPALRFLREPPDDANLMVGDQPEPDAGSVSASHTINGHSINFRLRYGNVNFMFTGDMNQESMQRLREANPDSKLRSEILKCPHHGSADFDMGFLRDVGPVVSMISSGDESVRKEYIHPRATLMAALGKASRQTPSIIFCTELAAFFAYRGPSHTDEDNKAFEGFERLNFGIAHVRTDGQRVLAFTHSGKEGLNEAYRFTVTPTGTVTFAPKVSKRSAPAAQH
jgi:beta-lactamase superfamily II metal-dependent hydrolase